MVRAEEKKLATQVQRYWNETESDDLADIDPEIERSKSYLLRFFVARGDRFIFQG